MLNVGQRCLEIESALFYALNVIALIIDLICGHGRMDAMSTSNCQFLWVLAIVKNMAYSKIVVHNTKRGLMSYIRPSFTLKQKFKV